MDLGGRLQCVFLRAAAEVFRLRAPTEGRAAGPGLPLGSAHPAQAHGGRSPALARGRTHTHF